ncbi:MAG: DNA polymerase III subunit delta [Candidatus Staskawiczbacteria bacterium RIFOXYD1_FULL_39_28]|uniref:DNA polymerase III subunit delta n=1 Tax=Candidatus Staskawiczbacteria bacterium RIFOXYC1_FULL_38_18 TaxID=1802229 RepID=A0A1G2JBJ0_9BACT|nr:MAG: DNA polymerase III subunit delta [Candidatus Staskawiczbacteria bacterium RIFOXYC1_FULL_38_18]OGZ91813.1 MAG: DNA polymerase III subunit delta [Candidatus Staskawiczbacteria bacterium RIFOXYD1_FULL_39_28]
MIYFIYGEDSFRSKRKLEEIIEGYKKVHKSGLNLIYIDAKENTFNNFYSNFKITSMFAEKKLIILQDVFANKNFQEDFLNNIKALEELKDIVVVYEKEKPDQRTRFFKTLKNPTAGGVKCQELNFLQPAQLRKWALQEFEKTGTKINSDALDLLTSFVKNDLWRMSNEINKLSSYKKNIEKKDVELQVRPDIENDIFKTIEAMAGRNKKMALSLLHKHLEEGEAPLYLLSMITYQFRNLLIIKELIERQVPYQAISKKTGLHPFVVQKTFYACNQFSLPQLKKIYQKIFQIDLDIKTGKIEPETALDMFISSL